MKHPIITNLFGILFAVALLEISAFRLSLWIEEALRLLIASIFAYCNHSVLKKSYFSIHSWFLLIIAILLLLFMKPLEISEKIYLIGHTFLSVAFLEQLLIRGILFTYIRPKNPNAISILMTVTLSLFFYCFVFWIKKHIDPNDSTILSIEVIVYFLIFQWLYTVIFSLSQNLWICSLLQFQIETRIIPLSLFTLLFIAYVLYSAYKMNWMKNRNDWI